MTPDGAKMKSTWPKMESRKGTRAREKDKEEREREQEKKTTKKTKTLYIKKIQTPDQPRSGLILVVVVVVVI